MDRLAILSVHTSPLAELGGKKTGGMNVYVRELAREIGARGIPVDIFTRRISTTQPYIDSSLGENVNVIHIKAGPAIPLDPDDVFAHVSQFAAGVIAYATRHNQHYPIIYSHYWLSGWVAYKLKEVWNTPFVQMFHTLGHMKRRIGAMSSAANERIINETHIVEWADRIVAATPAEQAQLLWLYRADRRKILIIPPGVDGARFQPESSAEAKAHLKLPVDKEILLFVGRIEPLKAVDTIIEATDIIRTQCPEVLNRMQVAIIGGNPDNPNESELQRLRTLTEARNLQDEIAFLGSKDHGLLPTYYAAAAAVIVPSDYESFGMVALEAMASGTPVIASEVGGLAFLVRDDETGYHIPVRDPHSLANRICTLLTNPAKRRLLGENAVALAQQYHWSKIADRLLSEFYTLLRERRPSAGMRQWLGMISHFEGETPCHTQTVSQNLALATVRVRCIRDGRIEIRIFFLYFDGVIFV